MIILWIIIKHHKVFIWPTKEPLLTDFIKIIMKTILKILIFIKAVIIAKMIYPTLHNVFSKTFKFKIKTYLKINYRR